MVKGGSGNGAQKQGHIGNSSDLSKLYEEFRSYLAKNAAKLKLQIDKIPNPAAKQLLQKDYERAICGIEGLASVSETIAILEGLEAILSGGVLQEAGRPVIAEATKPILPGVPVLARPDKTKRDTTRAGQVVDIVAKYVANFFVYNPTQPKLLVTEIIANTRQNVSSVRNYIRNGHLPLPLKREPMKSIGGKKFIPARALYLENPTISMGEFTLPVAILAGWKKFGIRDLHELYLYAPHQKVSELKNAVEAYKGDARLEVPEIDPFFAYKYAYERQTAKHMRLKEIFRKVLDNESIGDEQRDVINLYQRQSTVFANFDSATAGAVRTTAMFFMTKKYEAPDDGVHLVRPIVDLLKERGLFFAELVNVLDKPISKVYHALNLLQGLDKTSCAYKLVGVDACVNTQNAIGSLNLGNVVSFTYMPRPLRKVCIESLRYGVMPDVISTKHGGITHIEITVNDKKFEVRKDGAAFNNDAVPIKNLSSALQSAYWKRIRAT